MITRSRSLKPIFLLTAAMSMGYGSVFALLAEVRAELGFSESGVAFIAFAGLGMGFLAQIGLARFADRGHVALLVRIGLTCAAVGMTWSVFADQLWQWVGARMLLGLGAGMVSPAARRLAITRNPNEVGTNLGRQMAFDVSGIVVGPVVAALLASWFGLRVPFAVLAAVYIGLLAVTWALDLRVNTVALASRGTRALVRLPAIQAALAASVAFYITVGTFESLWAILLDDFGAETWLVGVTLSFFAIPAIAIAPYSGRLAQRRGPMRVVTVSLVVATLCTAAYGFVPLWVAVAISALNAVADAFTMPGNQVAVAVSTPPDQIAAGQGLLGAVGLATAGIAALAGGFVYEHAGREAVFVGASAIMLIFLAIARARGRALLAPPVMVPEVQPATTG